MMRFYTSLKLILFSTIIIYSVSKDDASAQDTVGTTVNKVVDFFATAAASYYGYPSREVIVLPQYGIAEEEIPVALYIARKAKVQPLTIVNLRKSGLSWMAIANRYHISPADFYFPATAEISSPPYGKAYGYYRNLPKKEWHTIVLDDDDIINLVNLRFISDSRHVSPVAVVEQRGQGRPFSHIYEKVIVEKSGRAMLVVPRENKGEHKGEHKGKHHTKFKNKHKKNKH